MDFDSFASPMNADSIDNVHKYYDSEDEQDLESNFSSTDSDTDSDKENTQPYSTDEESRDFAEHKNSVDDRGADDSIDPREVDGGRLDQNHAKSIYLDSETHDMVKRTEDVLARLSLQAQAILEDQPLSTQTVLTTQACDQVLRPYGQHGSQARFSESARKFLNGGDTIRRPGKGGRKKANDGRLELVEIDPAELRLDDGQCPGRKRYGKDQDDDQGGQKLATRPKDADIFDENAYQPVVKKRTGNARSATKLDTDDPSISSRQSATGQGLAESLCFRKTSDPISEWETRLNSSSMQESITTTVISTPHTL